MCTCHPFLLAGSCISDDEPCVSFPSLIQYNHLDTLPISERVVRRIWQQAFPRYKSKHYPTWKFLKDMFEDVESKPLSESRLAAAFINANVPVNVPVDVPVDVPATVE